MKVHVVKGNRGKWVMRWYGPDGQLKQRTTNLASSKSNHKAAFKMAAELERELEGDAPPKLMVRDRRRSITSLPNDPGTPEQLDGNWEVYRKYFFDVHMTGLSNGYQDGMNAILDKFQRWANLNHISELTSSVGRRWIAALRKEGRSPATIHSYWRHMTAFLAVAVDDNLISKSPKVRLPKLDTESLAKGRPLDDREFKEMKSAVDTVRPKGREQLITLLDGLWLSGLRIGEAHRLTWHESDSGFHVDLTGRRPKFVIRKQKNKTSQILPMVPEFAKALDAVSGMDRHGYVFKLDSLKTKRRLSLRQLEKVVSECGEKAKIKISKDKHATAHDLRRTFATRWALKVLPQILQQLMRHKSITTTMKYYADINSDLIADKLFEADSDE